MPSGKTHPTEMTLERFLSLHPWPEEHAAERRLEWLWEFDLPVEPDELWPIIADTSRMNRALGVSEMKFEDRGGARHGSSRPAGVRHEWIEVPWSWVAGRWMESVRLYERGFSKVVYGVYRLEPRPGGGTRLYVYFGAIPRGVIGWLALKLGFPGLERDYRRILPAVAQEVADRRPVALLMPPGELAPGAAARLVTIRDELVGRGLAPATVDRLIEWIRTGDEQDLYRIQVRERARAWGDDEDEVLRVCLHATRLGMLELSWDVICPHCRGAASEASKLGDVAAQDRCEVCDIVFGTSSAEALEITFHVHPSIRDVPKRTFCSAEPATKEHIRMQRAVKPGAEVKVDVTFAPGRYRMRLQGDKRYGYLDVGAGGPAEVTWRVSARPAEHAAAQAAAVRLVNDSAEERLFIIEVSQWNDTALRPGRLLSFQEFRDLFSEEYLSADVQLAIGEQTVLFTDMVGSTAMYAQRGDAAAFVDVKRHFNDVFEIIGKNRGAVVKTIGDAAMGAFTNPLDAVRASKQIHDHFHALRDSSPVRLRISLNTGPCIAVKLNTLIDYFGHSVNVAAKLQALAETWQIAMSDAVYRSPGVAEWLAEQGAALQELEYRSKAIVEPIRVKRWTVHPS